MSNLLNLEEIVDKTSSIAFFRLAFRPFFILGSLFSIISLLLWSTMLSGDFTPEVYGGELWWHTHEMLFGYVVAIIVGFLLTAVQTWTGISSIKGSLLIALVTLWLLARISMFLPMLLPYWFIALIDLSFLPVAAIVLAYPIVKVKQWRNVIFVPILLGMAYANAAMHCAVFLGKPHYLTSASTSMILVVILLMSIVAGRVFPMFTASGTQTERVKTIPWLEKLSIGSMLLVTLTSFNFIKIPTDIVASIFIITAVIHAIRVVRWRIWVTLKFPLVWSLHLSYWCIPLGLVLYGLAELTEIVSHSQAIHTFTVGAIAMMILSMISRVSLGHTGRKIESDLLMSCAYLLMFTAFVVRVFGGYWFENYLHVIFIAVLLWVVAYGYFVIRYFPILFKPRLDGKPG